jgi:hypothetical protein
LTVMPLRIDRHRTRNGQLPTLQLLSSNWRTLTLWRTHPFCLMKSLLALASFTHGWICFTAQKNYNYNS